MTDKEFIDACRMGGYCRKKTAEKYIADSDKQTFDTDDIIKVFRLEQNKEEAKLAHEERFRPYQGTYTTKHLKYPKV